MSTSYSPRMVTDGLQLYYDVNNIKSYPGEPTTNIVGIGQSINRVGGTFTTDTYVDGVKLLINTVVDNTHVMWNSTTGLTFTCSSGDSVTVSAEFRTTCRVSMRLRDNNGNLSIASTDQLIADTNGEWIRYSITGTALVTNPNVWWYLADYRTYAEFGTVEIRNWQAEVKGHVTQYTTGTRPTADGLKDLSGNAIHADLANATYDSNANLFYDGTGYANFSNAQVVGATEGTISAWVNASNFDANRMTVFSSEIGPAWNNLRCVLFTASNNSLTFSVATGASSISDGCNTGTILSTDTWYYVVGTYDGTYVKIYINGIQKDSYSTSIVPGVFTPTKTVVGWHYSDRYWNGYIDLLKVQNIALTHSQIVSDYNALKGRYV